MEGNKTVNEQKTQSIILRNRVTSFDRQIEIYLMISLVVLLLLVLLTELVLEEQMYPLELNLYRENRVMIVVVVVELNLVVIWKYLFDFQ